MLDLVFLSKFSEIWTPQAVVMLIRSSPLKSRKLLTRDVVETFATHATLLVTSPIQTDGHKMATLTLVLTRL